MEAISQFQIFSVPVIALVGFCLASYAIVANDVIQTLGTFLSSNAKRPWVILWVYAATIIVAVMAYGWFTHSGDIAFGRLNKIPFPEGGIQWWHAIPPLFLLVMTRFGIPVSTTFLVLTIFTFTGGTATEGVLGKMLFKSLMGYVVAFVAAGVLYALISRMFEKWVHKTQSDNHHIIWYVLQWLSTAFLWSQWLMQDLANIFVFLPRETVVDANGDVTVAFSAGLIIFATLLMVALHAIIFATRGGEIQKIVLTKTNTVDPRAATLIDLSYGLILWYFKELNDVPMSTTWVFLGLLAGRELAISLVAQLRSVGEAVFDVITDVIRGSIGLIVSVVLAIGLPAIATGEVPNIMEQVFGVKASEDLEDAGQSLSDVVEELSDNTPAEAQGGDVDETAPEDMPAATEGETEGEGESQPQ
ncbi:hypothetical protein [Woodsholea maritima]|uniref:hypothetical protein n=1 Tax=Woodsholea maritima TaxID=240237 RepID=UPI0003715772|nr:hypothetical protein [Woodsholea maritima]